MKLLFSEAKPDCAHYVFPYAVWAFPEPPETPADLFRAGFLPSSHQLDRFYLCRQVRVDLGRFQPSSENRRILRQGDGLSAALIPRAEFEFTAARREFCQRYAEAKFGPGVMSRERLDSLFHSPVTSHLLVFTDTRTGNEVGAATLYLEAPALAYYYYAFYDLKHPLRSLGLFMMTTAVAMMAQREIRFLHLGSCYSANALYKTQFAGTEFFNGFRWSDNLKELEFMLQRGAEAPGPHLLESELYRREFYAGDLPAMAREGGFSVPGKPLAKETRGAGLAPCRQPTLLAGGDAALKPDDTTRG